MVGPTAQSCRGVFARLNGPVIDLNLLSANLIYGDGEKPLTSAKDLLEQNADRKCWLIFFTPVAVELYARSFERIVRAALNSGARIVTVREMVSRATPIFSGF
jgi:hypothetical protein